MELAERFVVPSGVRAVDMLRFSDDISLPLMQYKSLHTDFLDD